MHYVSSFFGEQKQVKQLQSDTSVKKEFQVYSLQKRQASKSSLWLA